MRFAAMSTLLTLLVVSAAAADLQCPESWQQFQDNCYWISDFKLTFDKISSVCHLVSPISHPVSVHSLFEDAALVTMLAGRRIFLGLQRDSSSGTFRWSDSSPLDYTFWANGQPEQGHDCAVITADTITGQWTSADCGLEELFVCKQPLDPCPAGWTLFDSVCYAFNSTHGVRADALNASCAAMHPDAEPASVHSLEANWLLHALQGGEDGWIGLSRKPGDDHYSWDDGSSLLFTNWAADPTDKSYPYVKMQYTNGLWYFQSGTQNYHFFCQIIL